VGSFLRRFDQLRWYTPDNRDLLHSLLTALPCPKWLTGSAAWIMVALKESELSTVTTSIRVKFAPPDMNFVWVERSIRAGSSHGHQPVYQPSRGDMQAKSIDTRKPGLLLTSVTRASCTSAIAATSDKPSPLPGVLRL
jgi:hypothetical protein